MSKAKANHIPPDVSKQDEWDAEHILEVVLKRRNFQVTTRNDLAAAIAKVRANHPLKRGRGGAVK